MERHWSYSCKVLSLFSFTRLLLPLKGIDSGLVRNVPGVALYYTSLQQVRYTFAAVFPWAVASQKTTQAANGKVSTLPVLSHGGNMAAGALTRTAIGLVLNPLTIVKARFEVRVPIAFHSSSSFGATISLTRTCFVHRVTITRTIASRRP